MQNLSFSFFPSFEQVSNYLIFQVHSETSLYEVSFKIHLLKQELTQNQSTVNIDSRQTEKAVSCPIMQICFQSSATLGYLLALKYIEDSVMKKNLAYINANTFLDMIKVLNGCILLNDCYFCKEKESLKNEFRSESRQEGVLVIWDTRFFPNERTKETFQELDHYVAACTTQEQYEKWKKETRSKVWKFAFAEHRSFVDFNEADREVMQSFATFPPDGSQVQGLMEQFSLEFCQKMTKKTDVFDLMAWVHQTMVNIHPFKEGNGRTARLMMHWIAMSQSKQPVLIDQTSNYLEYVRKDQKEFAGYLRQLDQLELIKEIRNQKFNDLFKQVCLNEKIMNTYSYKHLLHSRR